MAHVRRFDHVGITVADLDSVTAFFVGLGLEVEGTGSVEGEFVETVCGIPGAHCEIAMLRPPDGGSRLELARFVTPDHVRRMVPEAKDLDVEVFALPNLGGVNVLIRGLLGDGVAASTRFDPQAKAVGEWLRSRHVHIPEELL